LGKTKWGFTAENRGPTVAHRREGVAYGALAHRHEGNKEPGRASVALACVRL
jgi:hypothetical protein